MSRAGSAQLDLAFRKKRTNLASIWSLSLKAKSKFEKWTSYSYVFAGMCTLFWDLSHTPLARTCGRNKNSKTGSMSLATCSLVISWPSYTRVLVVLDRISWFISLGTTSKAHVRVHTAVWVFMRQGESWIHCRSRKVVTSPTRNSHTFVHRDNNCASNAVQSVTKNNTESSTTWREFEAEVLKTSLTKIYGNIHRNYPPPITCNEAIYCTRLLKNRKHWRILLVTYNAALFFIDKHLCVDIVTPFAKPRNHAIMNIMHFGLAKSTDLFVCFLFVCKHIEHGWLV